MKRPRFTIGSLLILVVFLAVGMASLRGATEAWDSGVFGLTLVVLLASVLLAVHRTGAARAFWLGFALFGWAYLGLSEVPPVAARLPTTRALIYLDSLIPDRRPDAITFTVKTLPSVAAPSPNQVLSINNTPNGTFTVWQTASGKVARLSSGSTESFLRIGHSLSALLIAFIGAVLSRSLQARERRKAEEVANAHETSTSSPTS